MDRWEGRPSSFKLRVTQKGLTSLLLIFCSNLSSEIVLIVSVLFVILHQPKGIKKITYVHVQTHEDMRLEEAA